MSRVEMLRGDVEQSRDNKRRCRVEKRRGWVSMTVFESDMKGRQKVREKSKESKEIYYAMHLVSNRFIKVKVKFKQISTNVQITMVITDNDNH